MRSVWAGLVAVMLGACSGDKAEHGEEGPICSEISEACHEPGEAGDAEAEECHELAHEADEAACEAQRDRCVSHCEGLDTGS